MLKFKWWFLGPIALGIGLVVAMLGTGGQVPPKGGGVHGSIYADIKKNDNELIFLPGIKVFIKNVSTGAISDPETTDLDGRYMFPRQAPGAYQICWQATGWITACHNSRFEIRDNTIFLQPIGISPVIQQDPDGPILIGLIRGRVTLADPNTPCRFLEPYFGINLTAQVSVLDAAGNLLTRPVQANSVGEYVLAGIQRSATTYRVRATCEGTQAERTVDPSSSNLTGFNANNLIFSNHRPRINLAVALSAGKGVRNVSGGETLDVTTGVVDPDGDTLVYKWATSPGSGTVISSNAPTTKWNIPNSAGKHTLYLLISDRKGGYDVEQVILTTGAKGASFSGRVVELLGSTAIPGATVSVNGKTVNTDANGAFFITVPFDRSDRYVVNVTKIGYTMQSRLFNIGVSGVVFRLPKAQQAAVDPRAPIDVIDQREELSKQAGGQTKQRKGVRVQIDANSLVDKNGALAGGPLQLYLATLNVAQEPMPGDYGGVNRGGQEVNLVTYGSSFVELRDASGNLYNLAPGKTAKLTIPIEPGQLSNPERPSTIALWSYDEKTGFWKEEGTAALVGTDYVANVSHFSTLNTDLEKTNAACMRVRVDENTLSLGFTLRVTAVPTGQVFTFVLDNNLNAIYRLPANTDIKLEPLDSSSNVITEAVQVINSGPALAPGENLWPPYPYTTCRSDTTLTRGFTVPDAAAGNSIFLTFKGTGSEPEANAYYAIVDPVNTRTTLTDWWQQNGFGSDGLGGGSANIRAAYLNNNDLGFGRDMHCIQNGADVACYVTNYGNPDQNPGNADLAKTADPSTAGATVAMEYKVVEGHATDGRIVKFFVFKGGVRAPSANLDGKGEKFVPRLCMVCHGGSYVGVTDVAGLKTDPSSFREFDLDSFLYPSSAGFSRSDQEGAFKNLNMIVRASTPWPAISQLIDGWYAGGSSTQISSFVPTGWAGSASQRDFYSKIVATSCRTCHVAQSGGASIPDPMFGIDWSTYEQFKNNRFTIQSYVCGVNKKMPHALVTYRNFWLSNNPHRPDFLKTFVDPGSGWTSAFGTCQ